MQSYLSNIRLVFNIYIKGTLWNDIGYSICLDIKITTKNLKIFILSDILGGLGDFFSFNCIDITLSENK